MGGRTREATRRTRNGTDDDESTVLLRRFDGRARSCVVVAAAHWVSALHHRCVFAVDSRHSDHHRSTQYSGGNRGLHDCGPGMRHDLSDLYFLVFAVVRTGGTAPRWSCFLNGVAGRFGVALAGGICLDENKQLADWVSRAARGNSRDGDFCYGFAQTRLADVVRVRIREQRDDRAGGSMRRKVAATRAVRPSRANVAEEAYASKSGAERRTPYRLALWGILAAC